MKPNRAFISIAALMTSMLACLGVGPNPSATGPLWENANFNFRDFGWAEYANGIFYLLSADNQIFAWDEMTGATLWQIPAEQARLSVDNTMLYVIASDQCTAYNTVTGEVVEALTAERSYLCNTERRDDSNLNFKVSDEAPTLTASSAATGETLWQTNLGLDALNSLYMQPPASDPYIYKDRVIVSASGYKPGNSYTSYLSFQVFDPQTGALVWELTNKAFGVALVSGDTVFLTYSETGATDENSDMLAAVPTGPFELVAYDIQTGTELWHTTTNYSVNYYAVNNILYQCNDDYWFRWWDASTGTMLGEKQMSGAGQSCPNASNGNLYVADNIWLTTGFRTSPDAGLSFNGPYDGWITAFTISEGKVAWSTDIHEKSRISVWALGTKVALVGWENGFRGYLLQK